MEDEENSSMTDKYLISLGGYDGNLYGVQLKVNKTTYQQKFEENYLPFDASKVEEGEQKSDENKGFYSKLKFAFKAMDKSIRCLATNGRFLTIGGYDETIKLFNINKSVYVEVGDLTDHQGTITCLEFFKNDYLLSGSEDGEIFLWRIKDWRLIYKLRFTKTAKVARIAVHPTGKLCLAVYDSSHLVLWDLTKGTNRYQKKIKNEKNESQMNSQIKWDKSGNHYLILISNSVAVFSIVEDKAINTISFDGKVIDFAFIDSAIVHSVTHFEGEGESSESDKNHNQNNFDDNEEQSKKTEDTHKDEVLVVLGEKDILYYISNWRSQTPDIKILSTELGRHRQIAITPVYTHSEDIKDNNPTHNEALVSILNTEGTLGLMKASDLVVQSILSENAEDSGVESESLNEGEESEEEQEEKDLKKEHNAYPLYFPKKMNFDTRIISLCANVIIKSQKVTPMPSLENSERKRKAEGGSNKKKKSKRPKIKE